MGRVVDILVRDLEGLLASLGRDGGAIGPSVYDTAMVARLAPPDEGPEPALEWLSSQQYPDGGWGSPAYPVGRHLPTLAAVLALGSSRTRSARTRDARNAGLAFLREQESRWNRVPDDLPIAMELTFPALVREASILGVELGEEPFRSLDAIGEEKRRFIRAIPLEPGTPPAYAWEALGLQPSTHLLDQVGSVGTSPAATAKWLSLTADREGLASQRRAAAAFLRVASRATGTGVPGVVPHAHPVNRFEQIFSLFAVLSAGLFDLPSIAAPRDAILDELQAAMRPEGIGYADVFTADGDDTACAVAVLSAAGRTPGFGPILRFHAQDRFQAYRGERNPSPSLNAHALCALSLVEESLSRQRPSSVRDADSDLDESATRGGAVRQAREGARRFLLARQHPRGHFPEDKWHSSWVYTTYRAALALRPGDDRAALEKMLSALRDNQREDGSFGAERSTRFETAQGLLTLRALRKKGVSTGDTDARIERANEYLLARYRPFHFEEEPLWIGKEVFSMPRIDRAVELAALLARAIERDA